MSTDVLVIPKRNVPRLADLDGKKRSNNSVISLKYNLPFLPDDELACLMRSVSHVGKVVQKAYESDGLTIVCQVSPLSSCIRKILMKVRMENLPGRQSLTFTFISCPVNCTVTRLAIETMIFTLHWKRMKSLWDQGWSSRRNKNRRCWQCTLIQMRIDKLDHLRRWKRKRHGWRAFLVRPDRTLYFGALYLDDRLHYCRIRWSIFLFKICSLAMNVSFPFFPHDREQCLPTIADSEPCAADLCLDRTSESISGRVGLPSSTAR